MLLSLGLDLTFPLIRESQTRQTTRDYKHSDLALCLVDSIYIKFTLMPLMWCCGGVYTDGELHVGVDDDSFTRFNVTMVQQYFREEAVHQQHKVH